MSLYRLVNDVDLHAKNAKFHQSGYNSFCVRYQHHIEKQNTCKDSESDAQSDAHMHAYESVRKYVKENVLNNEVVSLASLRGIYVKQMDEQGFPRTKNTRMTNFFHVFKPIQNLRIT